MKRIFIVAFAMAAIVACNDDKGKSNSSETSTPDTAKGTSVTENPTYQKGLELVASSDCFTCHKIDDKLTGPSYREIANKYAGASDAVKDSLAHTIIKGSTGKWGTAIMIPHPDLSVENAKAMVEYVLLLKNN